MILHARDGCYRDMAGMHGTWRKVRETIPAAELIGNLLAEMRVDQVVIHLDRPVSNSGRFKSILQETAEACKWPWEIRLVPDPDKILRQTEQLVATADSGVIDKCNRWVNLARAAIEQKVPTANVVDLTGCGR